MHFLEPLLKRSSGPVMLWIDGYASPLATAVEGAFDSATRKKGLLGREHLSPDAALVIAPCSAVHTFAMRFPIDVIFASRDGRVTKLRPAMPASRIAMSIRAFAVIEMSAGTIARAGLRLGDRLVLR